jgi:hypothetical protein
VVAGGTAIWAAAWVAAEGESLDVAVSNWTVSSSAEPILLKTQTHFREIV